MILTAYFDGVKEATSSKGNKYGDVYVRGMDAEGVADMEQLKLRTFNEGVLAVAKTLKKDDVINLELQLRDATVEGITK